MTWRAGDVVLREKLTLLCLTKPCDRQESSEDHAYHKEAAVALSDVLASVLILLIRGIR